MECKNCIHYLQHYIKSRGQFRPSGDGHCTNKKPSGHFRKPDNLVRITKKRIYKKKRISK